MLNEFDAQTILAKTYPDATLKTWTRYKDLYLMRVEHPLPGEEDWDPFFSVHSQTGEVREFSILNDGDISEIKALEWKEVE